MGRHGGAESLPALIEEVASRDYAAILHIGDFAYDLDSQGGVVRDESTSVTYGAKWERRHYAKGYMQLIPTKLVYSTTLD